MTKEKELEKLILDAWNTDRGKGEPFKDFLRRAARAIIKAGWVELDEDQRLPDCLACDDCPCPQDPECSECYQYGGAEVLKYQHGWCKVKGEE